MDEHAASTQGQELARQHSRFGLGKGAVLLVAATVASAFVLGVVAVTRAQDPFEAGSTHVATLTRPQAECAYWYASVADDSDHRWRNQVDVPAAWVSPIEGNLRVTDDMHAEFTFDDVTIPMGGGDMFGDPPMAFTSDCPSTLNR